MVEWLEGRMVGWTLGRMDEWLHVRRMDSRMIGD
jgi:hypothetical protein